MSRALGKHLLVEFFGCDVALISDRARLRELLLEATRASGATIVTDVFHEFNPYGLSGVVVIAESHVAIHTWPEHACASLDVFTCGQSMDPYVIRDLLGRAFGARETISSEVERGLPRGARAQARPALGPKPVQRPGSTPFNPSDATIEKPSP
jgi:S-adenosylmethionine decarboxylase proenzyme